MNSFINNNFLKEPINEEPNITKFEKICKDLFPDGEPAAAVLVTKV